MSITPSEYACRVARHLWSEAELSNGLIQEPGAKKPKGTNRKPLDSELDCKKIDLLQKAIKREGIKRRWSVSQKDWHTLWTECKNSIYSTYKPSDENKQEQNKIEDLNEDEEKKQNDETDKNATDKSETENESMQVFEDNSAN